MAIRAEHFGLFGVHTVGRADRGAIGRNHDGIRRAPGIRNDI
jgi:hypothetical protein